MKVKVFIYVIISLYALRVPAQDQTYTSRYSFHSLVPQDTTAVYPWRFSVAATTSCMPMTFTANGQRHLGFLHPQSYTFAEKNEVGCEFTNQGFYPFNLYRRHHGLIFIRNIKEQTYDK